MVLGKLIKRSIYQALWDDLSRKEVVFLLGPRQSGKTTLMKIIQDRLKDKGEPTLYLSLDFEYDRQHFSSQHDLIQKIELEIGKTRGFVFIDEIQRKEDAGLFLKGIHDIGLPYKFIVSGSGSVDLKANIKESMLGRKRVYELYPVSLPEFINFKTSYKYENRLNELFSLKGIELDNLLLEYLNFGGYPRVILEDELKEKLRAIDEIYQGYIEKDIAYLLKVEKIDAFAQLIKILADQIGRLLNNSELSNTLGISLPTLKNYIWYAEQTYILQRLTPYYRNVRTEISKSPTVYLNDLGLRNYMLGIFGNLIRQDDLGFAFQNLVFMTLREKLHWTNTKIHYWRTKSGAEIDFLVKTGREIIPIEVKYSEHMKPMIPRSFDGFIKKYNPRKCIVINRNLKETVTRKNCEILFLTIWDLFIEKIE
ncbi:MAG: ATP-binding protein [Candidatus Scalindua sp.]|nr:ATP-binding protein [Candidatus Scalindua sp.]